MSDVIYSPSPILVFCNVSETGQFLEAEIGRRIIPEKQYQYFFVTDDIDITMTPELFKVEDGKLLKINLI